MPISVAEIPLAAWLLFAAPITAILFGFFVMRPLAPEKTHWPILLSCAVVTAASFVLAALVLAGHSFDLNFWHWAGAGDWVIDFGLRVDGPGVAVLTMVTFVGSLIHLYAAGYMKGDPGFSRFFLVFHLFFLAMIGLLTSNNFVQFYLYWELVGLASYLLIGHWFHKESARKAALKAFITNRVGDFGFLLALLIILASYRVSNFQLIYEKIFLGLGQSEMLPVIGLLLIWAACAKSAQFPLYFWLPDAMEGPTPTSALMHAATMVTAGVFLLVRAWPLIASVEWLPHLVAAIGAFTAVGAGIIAGTKKDLKRILAYSTVSHLGLMMMALGLNQVATAVFHLFTHGFFKATLFLCAGNIAHAIHQSTANVDDVGGWRKAMPWTYACFILAALSLAGVWPFAGFFSKDAILDAAWHHGGIYAVVGPVISVLSAFYIFRMLFLTFHGSRPEQKGLAAHPHEAGPEMTVPVVFLALGALTVGALGRRISFLVLEGLRGLPVVQVVGKIAMNLPGEALLPEFNWTVFALGTGMAALGAGGAYYLTMVDAGWDWRWRGGLAERVFESDFGWKPAVDAFARGVVLLGGFVGRVLDKDWWDGLLEGGAASTRALSDRLSFLSAGRLNDSLWWMAAGAALLLSRALR